MTARALPLPPQAGLVSVVVPVHNRPLLVREAVESALGQTYRQVEVVVVDDFSTDDTPDALEALRARERDRVRVVRNAENLGPGGSREAGRLSALGEFLQFLDSDDLLLPSKIEEQVRALTSAPDRTVAYGWSRARDLEGRSGTQPIRRTAEPFAALFPALLGGRLWITATPLYRAGLCAEAGGWSSLRLDEDWEFEARLGAAGARLIQVQSFGDEHRAHPGEHAGTPDWTNATQLRDRARAHVSILESARRAGEFTGTPEMARFARALFLLSRRCGAAGLEEEAARLFGLARSASTPDRARGWDFRLLGALASVCGWRVAGRLARRWDTVRQPDRLGAERAGAVS